MVGTGPIHGSAVPAPPKVSAADDDSDLCTHFDTGLDRLTNGTDHIVIQTKPFISSQRLSAEFQKHSLILRLHC